MIPNTTTVSHTHLTRHNAQMREMEVRLAQLADAGPVAIADRMEELDREWSAGRVAKGVLALVILCGISLAITFSWVWVVLPIVAGLFMLEQLFNRSSWLAGMFTEAGFRPGSEIEHERFALKALRGDFRHLPTLHDIETHDDINRLEGEGGIVVEPDQAKVDPRTAVREVLEATQT